MRQGVEESWRGESGGTLLFYGDIVEGKGLREKPLVLEMTSNKGLWLNSIKKRMSKMRVNRIKEFDESGFEDGVYAGVRA